MNKCTLAVVFIIAIYILTGCSGNGSNPLSPDLTSNNSNESKTLGNSPKVLWGYCDISIDPLTLEAEITPLRSAEFTCNVTQFLQPPKSPVNMLTINILPGSSPIDGYFEIRLGLTHPFPSHTFYRGFDVRGVLIADGTYSGIHDPDLVYAADGDTHLVNPDGYTRWWNPTEFTSLETIFGFTHGKMGPAVLPISTLNPYKYFADGFDELAQIDDFDPSNRGTFANGATNARVYEIQFKGTTGNYDTSFNYAIDASWHPPDPAFDPDYPVEAFSVSANCQESYFMSADFSGSTAYWQTSIAGGDIHCAIEIADWGSIADGVTVPDEVSAIWIESPTLFDTPVDILSGSQISNGNGYTSSVFTFDISNVHPTGIEDQLIMVTVESSNPNTYRPQIDAGDLFDYPDSPLAAYMFFNVPIIDESPNHTPIVLSIIPDHGFIDTGDLGVTIIGEDFAIDADAKLVNTLDPGLEIPGLGITVAPDGTSIDCTFDMDSLDGAVLGAYHVVVTNPGPPVLSGQLDSGFDIVEASGCDTVFSNEIYTGNLTSHNEQVHSVAINHDGLLLSRVNAGGNHLYGFDVTQNGPVTGTPIIENGLYLEHSLGDIDVCDVTDNIIYAICGGGYEGLPIRSFVAYTSDGVLIGEYESVSSDHLQGVDTDDDGSLWVVGHSYDPASEYHSPLNIYLEHWLWDDIGNEYVYDPVGSVDITDVQMYNGWADIYSMAVSYSEDLLLIYTPGSGWPYDGRIDVYDISSGVPVHSYIIEDILPASQGGHAFYNWRTAIDVEIDHSDLLLEHCRVLVSARLNWDDGEAFVKIDTDGTVLDTWQNVDADDEGGMYWCHGFNPVPGDPDNTYLVAMEDNVHTGDASGFHVFEMPAGW